MRYKTRFIDPFDGFTPQALLFPPRHILSHLSSFISLQYTMFIVVAGRFLFSHGPFSKLSTGVQIRKTLLALRLLFVLFIIKAYTLDVSRF